MPKTSGNWSQTQSYSLKMLNFKVSPVIGTLETNHNLATMSSVDINPVQQARINEGVLVGKHDQVLWA